MNYRCRVLVFLFFLSIITFVDRVCISVVGKSMQEDLQLSPTQWGWMLGIFSLAYGLFEIPAGIMGDKIDPRKVLTRIVSSPPVSRLAQTGPWAGTTTRWCYFTCSARYVAIVHQSENRARTRLE